MTAQAHLAALEAQLDAVHEYFLCPLPPHVREMYARDLAAYALPEICWAIETYRISPPPLGHKKVAPKPHDLIALLNQELADRQIADALASKIWACIAKYGRTQTALAMQAIGPEGEEVVHQLGGWILLCKTACAADVNLWNAQLRDKALAVRAQNRQKQARDALAQAMGPPKLAEPKLDELPPMSRMADILEHMKSQAAVYAR